MRGGAPYRALRRMGGEPATGVAGDMETCVHRSPVDVPPGEWDALSARSPASLAGSRAWLEAALATIDRTLSPLLLAVRRSGRLVGLASLVVDERGPQPLVRFAAAPHNDLADLLTLPGHEEVAARAAVDALASLTCAEGWNIRLEDLDPAGTLVAAGCAGDGHRSFALEPSLSAPVIDLRDSRARPSVRRLRRLDRSLKRLRAQGQVEFVLRSGAAMVEALEEFKCQRDIRLRRLGRDLALPPTEFLDAVVNRLAPLGRCAFMEMLVDGVAVARDLYLLDGAVAMLWLRALDMNWLAHSCGHLLLRKAIERFAAEGYGVLDLGRGDEPYKFHFGARERRLLNARLSIDEC